MGQKAHVLLPQVIRPNIITHRTPFSQTSSKQKTPFLVIHSTPSKPTTIHSSSQARGLRLRPSVSVSRSVSALTWYRFGSSGSHRGSSVVCEAQDTDLEAAPVNDATWQLLVLNSEFPEPVEFWAPWCGPCRMIHPVIDELTKQYAGKLKCYKLHTDESPSIATRYGIRSIPTVIVFISGEKKDAVIGAVPKSTLSSIIEKFL